MANLNKSGFKMKQKKKCNVDLQKEKVEGWRQGKAELSAALLLVGGVVSLLTATFPGVLDSGGSRLLLSQGLKGAGEPELRRMMFMVQEFWSGRAGSS